MSYYVHRAGETFGPFTPETVVTMLRSRQLAAEDLAVEEGCEDWQPLRNIVDPQVLNTTPPPPPPPMPAEERERVFYSGNGVTVTFSRFVIGSQTFAMRNVSSVRIQRIPPKRGALIIGLLIGLFFTPSEESRVFGISLMVVMLIILLLQRSTYAILLTASGGEVRALLNRDRQWLSAIVSALNEAIVARG